ncbi:Disease resistance protein L6 [Linum perenne]
MWSFFWALVAFFLALAVYFHLKKSSRITNATTSSQPEPSTEQQSSAPSSSNTPVSVEYEVFLSFRGPDVRTNFADFLHKYLVHTKIRTFLDNEDLRKGEKMAPSLVKAIKESKVYIPILSPDYASSKWCLQELSQMVKCCVVTLFCPDSRITFMTISFHKILPNLTKKKSNIIYLFCFSKYELILKYIRLSGYVIVVYLAMSS